MPNSFRAATSQDFTIVDPDNRVVGHLRVKPNGVLWRPRDRQRWHRVTLDQFANFAIENGNLVDH